MDLKHTPSRPTLVRDDRRSLDVRYEDASGTPRYLTVEREALGEVAAVLVAAATGHDRATLAAALRSGANCVQDADAESATTLDSLLDLLIAEPHTCRDCGATVEHLESTGWVDVQEDETYDVCPERYDAATDTQHGHRPA